MKNLIFIFALLISVSANASGTAVYGDAKTNIAIPEGASIEEVEAIIAKSELANECNEGVSVEKVSAREIKYTCWADSLGGRADTIVRKVQIAAETSYVGNGYTVTLAAGEYTFASIESAINYADVTDACTDGFSVAYASTAELEIDCWADSLGLTTYTLKAK